MYKWDADEALRLVRDSGITVLMGAPTMLLDLLNREDALSMTLPPLPISARGRRYAAAATRSVSQGTRRVGWRRLGLTESGGTGAAFTGHYAHERPGTSGFPSPIMEFRFCDEHGSAVAEGARRDVGALRRHHQRVCVGRGDESVFEDGWLETGDIGYIDEEGLLHICGRAKDMVLRGGENIYPSEVEAMLLSTRLRKNRRGGPARQHPRRGARRRHSHHHRLHAHNR